MTVSRRLDDELCKNQKNYFEDAVHEISVSFAPN